MLAHTARSLLEEIIERSIKKASTTEKQAQHQATGSGLAIEAQRNPKKL
jgi:hypothetical protein